MEETTAIGNIKKSWKCLAPGSNKIWSGLNTTKALAHGYRDPGYCKEKHVKPYTGAATPEHINLFGSFLKEKLSKKSAVKQGSELVAEDRGYFGLNCCSKSISKAEEVQVNF
eukprot:scaffold4658_cov31-Cyclotella_meneghiniana.AAC.2